MNRLILISTLAILAQISPCIFAADEYHLLGCYNDKIPRVIAELETSTNANVTAVLGDTSVGKYKSREDAIAKCFKAAKVLGYTVFAVQDGGQCFSSATAEADSIKAGESTACLSDGKGGPMANAVYKAGPAPATVAPTAAAQIVAKPTTPKPAYVEKKGEVGCGDATVPEGECKAAAASLTYMSTNGFTTVNYAHLPHGCFVGHEHTQWTYTYYNSNAGKKNAAFKSICKA